MLSAKDLSPSITDMIRFDHSHVLVTFHQYVATKKPHTKKALAETICDALEIHATLEEEIFYPVMRERGSGGKILDDSVPEHNQMRTYIAGIRNASPETSAYDELVFSLMREVMHHVADEETVLLPEAERIFDKHALNELGVKMTARRMKLLAPKAGKVAMNTAVGFSQSTLAIAASVVGVLFAARALTRKPV